jgi:hypothetical protein
MGFGVRVPARFVEFSPEFWACFIRRSSENTVLQPTCVDEIDEAG